jgi:HPt (histidine-containing phosphotransfer) domain-containing protein
LPLISLQAVTRRARVPRLSEMEELRQLGLSPLERRRRWRQIARCPLPKKKPSEARGQPRVACFKSGTGWKLATPYPTGKTKSPSGEQGDFADGRLAPPRWKTGMQVEQSTEPELTQGKLHRLLRLAAAAHGLPDAVLVTAHALLRYVPRDAAEPISPARVQDLAEERGCDPRTVRSHIRRLEAYGLVVDRAAGGGRRMLQRRGVRLVVLQGIDFSPMLAAADALALAAIEAEAERDERRQLCARISALKRQLRNAIAVPEEGGVADRATSALQACPARHRGLSLRELAALAARLELAAKMLMDSEDVAGGRIFLSDRSAEKIRPTTTEKNENPVCRAQVADRPVAADRLELVSLERLLPALPFDWRIHIERDGPVSWPAVIGTARERAGEIGVTEATWAEAQSALGPEGAAILVLLADADSLDRGGSIRCPAAWVRAMAVRAERQPLHLHRNLFGLLRRRRDAGEAAPCPTGFSSPQLFLRSPCPAS